MEIEHQRKTVVDNALAERTDILQILTGIGVITRVARVVGVFSLVSVGIHKEPYTHGVHALIVQPRQQLAYGTTRRIFILCARFLVFGQQRYVAA